MLRLTVRALAACAFIATFTLLATTASAQFPLHPVQQILAGGIGPDPDNPEETGFADTVLIRNQLALVGEPFALPGGRVAVFTATTTVLIDTGMTLRPSDPVTFGRFGQTLAFRDGVVVVGSDRAAYVFRRNSSGVWTQRQKLTPPPVANVPSFVGALRYEDGTLAIWASGAVYIYQRDATGKFIRRQKLVPPDNGGFNASISTAGPVMVVGGSGRAYIFRRNSTGVWRHQQTLIPSGFGTERERFLSGFGGTVAIDRGMILVGAAEFAFNDDPLASGAVYGFILAGSAYVETFKLQPRLEGYGNPYVNFGRMLAMFGERIVVGALDSTASDDDAGVSVFTYTRAGSSVLPRGVARRSNGFSTSLALADDRLLVGVPVTFVPSRGLAILYRLNRFE